MADGAALRDPVVSNSIGPVQLTVPPEPTMSRVARLAASGVASLAGCTVDEIEDIKIALSEVLIALIEHGDGERVELEFDVVGPGESAGALPAGAGRSFVVRGSSRIESFDLGHPDLVLCRTVLDGVCTAHDIRVSDGVASIVACVAMLEIP